MSDESSEKNSGSRTPGPPARFIRKKLTPFLAHEMIYDYATDQLDPERRVALEEFLEKDHEAQVLLKNIELATLYTAKMTKVSVDAEILQQLQEAESAVSLGKRYSSWREWPETLRWSLTAIALSLVVASVVAIVPWAKLTTKSSTRPDALDSVEVAQIPQPKTDDTTEVASSEDSGSGDEAPDDLNDEGSGDDVADGTEGGAPAAHAKPIAGVASGPAIGAPGGVSGGAAVSSKTRSGIPAAVAAAAKLPLSVAQRPAVTATATSTQPPTAYTAANAAAKLAVNNAAKLAGNGSAANNPLSPPLISETPDSHAAGDAKAKGFVYRAFMTLDNLDEIAPKIKDDIVALGAEKAGEVELGWKRGSGHYYHFTLPAENEKKILERLQVYGPVRISKDPHPRVMPPGELRFILWVESAADTSHQ